MKQTPETLMLKLQCPDCGIHTFLMSGQPADGLECWTCGHVFASSESIGSSPVPAGTAPSGSTYSAEAEKEFSQGEQCARRLDLVKSRKHYQAAADLGHDRAQFLLGQWYEMGLGFQKDPEKAKVWYRKAAEQGNAAARDALERMAKK